MGDLVHGLVADGAGRHLFAEHFFGQAKAVSGVDLAPVPPAEHRRRVEEHHAAHRRVEAGVQEGVATGLQGGPRVARFVRRCEDLLSPEYAVQFVSAVEGEAG